MVAVAVAVALGAGAGILVAAWVLRSWELHRARRQLETWRDQETERLVSASQRQSRAVVRGQITEQITPLLGGFGWNPADARFLGKPVDYVVFDGYCEVRSGDLDRLREIVFVDVKTGRSGLSKVERRVKASVERGAVHGLVITEGGVPKPGRREPGWPLRP
ncbi:MAG: hypothetical protein M3063_02200 [Actinomycetota bacterium]|nr:hypothetical protein [Actinomycetota bacterium]